MLRNSRQGRNPTFVQRKSAPVNPVLAENQDDPVTIPCYFINLDHAVSRRQHMQLQAGQIGVSLTRIPGVIGSQLTLDEARTWNPRPLSGKYLSANEIGCFLSHRRAWKSIAEGQSDFAAVFEDDICLSRDASELLANDHWIPPRTDLIKIETFNRKVLLKPPFVPVPGGRQLAKLAYQHYGTAGYIVSRTSAARLLAATKTFSVPVDVAMFSPKSRPVANFDVMQLSPAICIQEMRALPQVAPQDIEASAIGASRSERLNRGQTRWRQCLKAIGAPIENAVREARQHTRSILHKSRWGVVDYS